MTHPLPLKSLVRVASRTTPGINKPGGVARVTAVDAEHATYDVAYVLGGRERAVAFEFVEPHEDGNTRDRAARHEPVRRLAEELVASSAAAASASTAPSPVRPPRRREPPGSGSASRPAPSPTAPARARPRDDSDSPSRKRARAEIPDAGPDAGPDARPDAHARAPISPPRVLNVDEDDLAHYTQLISAALNSDEDMDLERAYDVARAAGVEGRDRLHDMLRALDERNSIFLSADRVYRV